MNNFKRGRYKKKIQVFVLSVASNIRLQQSKKSPNEDIRG